MQKMRVVVAAFAVGAVGVGVVVAVVVSID